MLNRWGLVMVFDPTVRGESLTYRTSSKISRVCDLKVRGKSLTCRTSALKLLEVYDLQVCHIESQ